jgi:hypothetical protein
MHRIGVHVEDARAVPEADEGADDGGVVVEEDFASQDETAITGPRTEVGARSGGVVEAATFLGTNLAVWHLHLRGGTEGDHEEQRDIDHPNQTQGFARVESLHGSPLCGLAAASPLLSHVRAASIRGRGGHLVTSRDARTPDAQRLAIRSSLG